MSLNQLKENLPDFAKDIKLNLAAIFTESGSPGLTQEQIYGTALASAYAIRHTQLVEAIYIEAANLLPENAINAAKSAAAIMAMNNIYYRFIHEVSDKEYGHMPAKLRMNVINNSGVAKTDFEMYSLAVSAINGCGLCMDAHAKALEHAGAAKTAVQSVIRIAAVLNSAAQTLFINNL